jgi:hypothetical protein
VLLGKVIAMSAHIKNSEKLSQAQWFKLIIIAKWEVDIWRIVFWGQPREKGCKTPYQPRARCGGLFLPSRYEGKHR